MDASIETTASEDVIAVPGYTRKKPPAYIPGDLPPELDTRLGRGTSYVFDSGRVVMTFKHAGFKYRCVNAWRVLTGRAIIYDGVVAVMTAPRKPPTKKPTAQLLVDVPDGHLLVQE